MVSPQYDGYCGACQHYITNVPCEREACPWRRPKPDAVQPDPQPRVVAAPPRSPFFFWSQGAIRLDSVAAVRLTNDGGATVYLQGTAVATGSGNPGVTLPTIRLDILVARKLLEELKR